MKNFFLEGDRFIGKSTLLQQLAKEMKIPVSGFYVNRKMDTENKVVGFELRAASELSLLESERSFRKEHCFIENNGGKQERNLAVFDEFGCKLLYEASTSKNIVLLDEIGGIELLSDSFSEALYALIKQPKKIIGVFKSEANYQNQRLHSRKELEISQQRERLRKVILETDGEIKTLTKDNRQTVAEKLYHFLSY